MKIKIATLALALAVTTANAQQPPSAPAQNGKPPAGVDIPAGVVPPPDYIIGPEDVLAVLFWREKEMSSDVVVRPDGMISLPLLNDVHASGLTPDQLRLHLTEAAAKFVTDPTVSIVVKAINSRKVYVTGMVGRPGPYPLTGPTTVIQMLAIAGGVHEFADEKNITILRTENGRQIALRFNYKDVSRRKHLEQNIELKPGDTIIVP